MNKEIRKFFNRIFKTEEDKRREQIVRTQSKLVEEDKKEEEVIVAKNTAARCPWSAEEIKLFEQGLSDIEISKKTGRSMSAVRNKRRRL